MNGLVIFPALAVSVLTAHIHQLRRRQMRAWGNGFSLTFLITNFPESKAKEDGCAVFQLQQTQLLSHPEDYFFLPRLPTYFWYTSLKCYKNAPVPAPAPPQPRFTAFPGVRWCLSRGCCGIFSTHLCCSHPSLEELVQISRLFQEKVICLNSPSPLHTAWISSSHTLSIPFLKACVHLSTNPSKACIISLPPAALFTGNRFIEDTIAYCSTKNYMLCSSIFFFFFFLIRNQNYF